MVRIIELYYWTTPNRYKITMCLEETALPYIIRPVHLGTGAHHTQPTLNERPGRRASDRVRAKAGPCTAAQ
jgi:GST-like protein